MSYSDWNSFYSQWSTVTASSDGSRELELAQHAAATGGRAAFAILRSLHDDGPATTRRLTEVTAPLGTDRQTSVEKIVKRLQREGLVSVVSPAGIAHYGITSQGESVVLAIRFGAIGHLKALEARRLLLVQSFGQSRKAVRSLLASPEVEGVFDTDGDYQYAAVCRDDLALVRKLEDQLRELGAAAHSLRLTAFAEDEASESQT